MKKKYLAVLLGMSACSWYVASAAEAPALDKVVVHGYRTQDEQVVRTGGDVVSLSREDLEKGHYQDVADAIRHIPGVDVQEVGYKSFEFGYSTYQPVLTLNGDSRVVILVDGRRMSNEANSSVGADHNKSQLYALPSPESIERIEVIKGASAVAYGADATGGVINIITKQGEQNHTSLSLGLGSWAGRQLSISNEGKKDHWYWYASYAKDKRKDMQYRDREYKKRRIYKNSGYDEDNAFLKLGYQIDSQRTIEGSYQYRNTFAYYPIMAPDYSVEDALRKALESGVNMKDSNGYNNFPVSDPRWNRYHRWWYVFNEGSFTENSSRSYNLRYSFVDQDGLESSAQIYQNQNKYFMDRVRPAFDTYTKLDRKQYSWTEDKSQGINLRWSKKLNEHHLLYSGLDYSKDSFHENSYASYYPQTNTWANGKRSYIRRNTQSLFLQDKMSFGKWTWTLGARYQHYGSSTGWSLNSRDKLTTYNTPSYQRLTFGAFADYEWRAGQHGYFSWSQVYNAPYAPDIAAAANQLQAEKGNAYTIGFTGQIGKDNYGVHYTLTKMDNTFGKFSVPREDDPELWESKVTNVKAETQSFGFNYQHALNDDWTLSVGYSHAHTNIGVHSGTSPLTTAEDLRNSLHYNNRYVAGLHYNHAAWRAALDAQWYTGMDTRFFSNSRFFVLDARADYQINKQVSVYAVLNNLTDEIYETKASPVEGIGALPMPGRNWRIGVKYQF